MEEVPDDSTWLGIEDGLEVQKVNGPGGEVDGLTRLNLELDGSMDRVQVGHKLEEALL